MQFDIKPTVLNANAMFYLVKITRNMEINTFFKQNYIVTILRDLYLSTFAPD